MKQSRREAAAKQSRREPAAKQSRREPASLSVAASRAGGSSTSLRRCKPHRRTAVPLQRRSSDADLSLTELCSTS
nr:hypothetical protein Itr_chr07CG08340 [Ipomoea trifida]